MNSKKAITLLVLATLLMALVPIVPVNAITVIGTFETPDMLGRADDEVLYGDTVKVNGTGVTAGATVELYWDSVSAWNGEAGLLNTTTAAGDGSWDVWFDVPEAVAGDHYLWVRDASTTESEGPTAVTVFPSIELSPDAGLTDDEITITGYGYAAEEEIDDVTWDAAALTLSPATPETDELGTWTATCDALAAPGLIVALDVPNNSGNATFTVGPSIAIDVDEGPTGMEIEITGRGYTATATIDAGAVTMGPDDCYLEDSVTVKGDGTFEFKTFVPQMADTGDYTVTVTEAGAGVVSATETFEVNGLAEISVTPEYGPQGSVVTVEGWNFTESAQDVVLDLDGEGDTTVECDNNGHFEASFIIPAVASGVQTLTATQADYAIEATTDFRAGIMIVILSPTSGPSGTSLTLTGTGFSTGGEWNATFGDDTWVDSDNAVLTEISATDYVPSVEPGIYTLTVWDVDADIQVMVDFEVTAGTEITTDPVVAPADYTITVEGTGFADDLDFDGGDFGDIELVYYNDTEEWTPALTTTWAAGDDAWDDGYFEFEFDLEDSDALDIGMYMINVTDGTGLLAQLEFEVVEETIDVSSRKPEFNIGDTLAFDVESSFAMVDSYIEIYEPNGDLYWSTDPFADWLSVGLIQRVLYADQVAGGNPLVFLDDAPLGTWTWEYYDVANDEVDSGAFTVVAAPEDVVGEQVADLANDITELASQLTDVSDDFADVQSSIADVAAVAADAVTAANAAVEAVNSVATTANEASQAAADAAEAATAAKDAASGLTTLVYGAIGAALVAALAAIVSLMQISRRIAG